MEILKGTVSGSRHTLTVTGGANDSGVSTKHHAIFKIGDVTVTYNSSSPMVISDGDRIVVAGKRKGRMIQALAYRNDTAGVKSNSGKWSSLGVTFFSLSFGLLALFIGLIEPRFLFDSLDFAERVVAFCLAAFFCPLGLYYLYWWLSIRRAINLLDIHY